MENTGAGSKPCSGSVWRSGCKALDVSNANTVVQLSSERDKHHCAVEFNFDSPRKDKKNK